MDKTITAKSQNAYWNFHLAPSFGLWDNSHAEKSEFMQKLSRAGQSPCSCQESLAQRAAPGWLGITTSSSLATLVFSRALSTTRKAPGAYLNLQKPLHQINICTDLFTQLYFHFIFLQEFTNTLDITPSAQKSPRKQMKDVTWYIFHVWEAEFRKGKKTANILFSKWRLWAFCCHCKNEMESFSGCTISSWLIIGLTHGTVQGIQSFLSCHDL